MNATLQIIKSRRSNRAFLPDQIKEEELQLILEAGFYAPSSSNKQPWHFTVIQDKGILDWLSDCFREYARKSESKYLQSFGNQEDFHVFYHAPTVILLSGEVKKASSAVDCAAACQNMLLAAESLGLGSCWIGFIAHLLNSTESENYLMKLGVPEGYKQFHSVALGYKKNLMPLTAPKRRENIINYIR